MGTLQENQSLNAEYERNKKEREMKEEIEKLQKENNDLRKLYQRTYKHLFEKGNDELARYFQAQIDECPTFYIEPIIDYYEETKRLNNIINELEKWIEDMNIEKISYFDEYDLGEYKAYKSVLNKLKELKESDKE